MSIHPHPLMGRSRPPGQETQPTRDLLRETPAAAGSGRSKPWRRTNPIPRAAARKLILPRASSASAGTVPRSAPTTTLIHPHPLMDRSRTPGQETRPTKDNWPRRDAGSQETRPTRDLLRWKPERQRDRAGASIGGEHPIPSRGSAKADPSQSLLSERRTDPAERPHDTDCNQRRRFRFLSERRHGPAERPPPRRQLMTQSHRFTPPKKPRSRIRKAPLLEFPPGKPWGSVDP